MKTQEQIKTYLQDLDGDTLKRVWNDYCYTNSLDDNNIYDMDEFDDIMSDSTPTDIAERIFYGDFKPCDNYFNFDGRGNLASFDYLEELISIDDLAQYICSTDDDLNNYDLRHFLDEDNEE